MGGGYGAFLVKPVTKSMIVDTLVNVFAQDSHETTASAEGAQAERLQGARLLPLRRSGCR